MTLALTLCAAVLAANLALGLARLSFGPKPLDRLAAAQFAGTLAVAILLILAQLHAEPALRLVALALALLGAVTVATFARVAPAHVPRGSR